MELAPDGNRALSAETPPNFPAAVEVDSAEDVRDTGTAPSSPVSSVFGSKDDRKIQKLDDDIYKPWGSRSRSSSVDAGESTICKGGPGKRNCGEIVRHSDLGVECDKCTNWFHTSCQLIPRAAYDALARFKVLSWLCPECKLDIKETNGSRIASLESKLEQLGKSMNDHTKLVVQSLKEQEETSRQHTILIERTVTELYNQKTSYAEIVKGSCNEAAEKVLAKVSSAPSAVQPRSAGTDMHNIAQVFDEFLDKDRRKNNLVVHNLPESKAASQGERTSEDISLFQEALKDTLKVKVSVSKAFRVGRTDTGRDRLLIVTLDTPGVKQDILRMAPQLRSSDKWGNVYITPDLSRTEREAARKLREELATRRRAGETDIMIRRGKIVKSDNNARPENNARPGSTHPSSRTLPGTHEA